MQTYPVEKDGMITQCCVCKRIRVKDENDNIFFEEMKMPDSKIMSHTYCPDCFPVVMAKFQADISELREQKDNLMEGQ